MTIIVKYLILLISMLFSFFLSYAQVSPESDLHSTLKAKDSLLFDAAFNRCEIETMKALFTEDFEFYHDKVGLTSGREEFLEPVRVNCESWVGKMQPSKRILIDNSLEVYPLYNQGELYAAIQHGIHRFEFLNAEGEYQKGDTARFTHLWVLEDGAWKIKRELSYDHIMHQEEDSK